MSITFNQYHCLYLCLPPDTDHSRLHGPGQRPEVRVRGTLGLTTSTSPFAPALRPPCLTPLQGQLGSSERLFLGPVASPADGGGARASDLPRTSPVPALLSAPRQQRDGLTRPDQESAAQWAPTPQGGGRSLFATPWSGGHAGKVASRLETSPSVHSLFGIQSLKITPSSTGILSFHIHISLPRGPRPTASSQTQSSVTEGERVHRCENEQIHK